MRTVFAVGAAFLAVLLTGACLVSPVDPDEAERRRARLTFPIRELAVWGLIERGS